VNQVRFPFLPAFEFEPTPHPDAVPYPYERVCDADPVS
jgi:hypothetical protein